MLSSEDSFSTLNLLVAFVTAAVAVLLYLRRRIASSRLPPGPPSGYLGDGRFDMPAEPYKRFAQLAALYGEHDMCIQACIGVFEAAKFIHIASLGPLFSFRLGYTPVIGLYFCPRSMHKF